MSKMGWRTPEARLLVRYAATLGYQHRRTATGHLRFVHGNGAVVFAPSKGNSGCIMRNIEAELRRQARASRRMP